MLFLDSRRAQRAVTLAITVIAIAIASSISAFAQGNKSPDAIRAIQCRSEWT